MAQLINTLHQDFLEEMEIGLGRSAKTVENYDRYLRRFYEQQHISKITEITAENVRNFRRWLNERTPRPHDLTIRGVSLATQNYHLIALRQFLKYLSKRNILAMTPEKVGLAKLGERDIDVLYPEEVDTLLHSAKKLGQKNPQEVGVKRDWAVLEVLYSTGMRVSEAVSLNRDDLREESNEIAVRGKGNKIRVVFLSMTAREAIKQYIAAREDLDPALFIRHSLLKTGISLRLTPRSIQRLIKKYAALAGITKQVTPHTLRHSFATDLLANGADVRQVQQLLGHASITTTQAYTHLTDVHLREAHAKFHRTRD